MSICHDHCDWNSLMLNAFNSIKHESKPYYADIFVTIEPSSSKGCLPLN